MTDIEKVYLQARITALEKKVQELENQNELLTIKKEKAESLLTN
jgi:hypothetical protein